MTEHVEKDLHKFRRVTKQLITCVRVTCELHKYQLLMLVHKFVYHNDKLPPAFANYFMLNRNVHSYNTRKNHDLHLQNLQTTVGKKNYKI